MLKTCFITCKIICTQLIDVVSLHYQINNNNNLKHTIMKTRKEAAIELNVIYNNYEVRQNSLKTTYNKIFKDGDNWRLIGHAHDYTV